MFKKLHLNPETGLTKADSCNCSLKGTTTVTLFWHRKLGIWLLLAYKLETTLKI